MSNSSLPKHLAVFAKYWEPGEVKTRLASTIGPKPASLIYQALVQNILSRLSGFSGRKSIVIWPPERVVAFESDSPDGWESARQAPGDLGKKLSEFFRSQFAEYRQRVVVIGADSPDLPINFITEAFELLRDRQVVIGPAVDGGYYLIGMNEFTPIFDEVDWGTPQVLAQTVKHLERLNARFALLGIWPDVDRWDDLLKLQVRLSESKSDPAAVELLHRIQEILATVRQ